jgi:hypothetical protein
MEAIFSPLSRYSGGEGLGVRGKNPAANSPPHPNPSPPEYRERGALTRHRYKRETCHAIPAKVAEPALSCYKQKE